MRNYFTFDDKASTLYGVYITGTGTYNAPERAYETINVPGRDGAVLGIEKHFENIELVYPAFIYSNFKGNLSNLKGMLMSKVGYKKLSDTYHPDEYRLAFYRGGMEVEARTQHDAGQFDIVFECKPQRYLVSGDTVTTFTTSPGSISNPTSFTSRPIIRVYGYGTLTVNSNSITISQSTNSYVDIDSEVMDCYKGSVNMNGLVSFQANDFPTLIPGSNSIAFSGNITKVEVTPKWWKV